MGGLIYVRDKPIRCLFGGFGDDRNEGTILTTLLELDSAITEGVERVVLAHTHVLTGVVDGTALTDDDVTGDAMLTAKDFHA